VECNEDEDEKDKKHIESEECKGHRKDDGKRTKEGGKK
jgi:hypothetical protein